MSSPTTVLLDTSPLIVLIVGTMQPDLLGARRHLKAFTPEDVFVLSDFLPRFKRIATTPHVATEVAYFIEKLDDRRERRLRIQFVSLLHQLDEIAVASRAATSRKEFAWLDLADCTLLEAAAPRDVLLSTDAPLVYRRQELGFPAVNFNELREQAGII